ncbi:MAG TPA: segregation/condensation protein A [Nitrospiraceae bacterium]|nr:segregation/condensation protein A [Nitrospiraceae bacterium]
MDENQIDLPYQVRLDTFEGPLDLLLHLIKKNEINIYDIPIALITQQYLEYLNVMTSLNLAVAGDFLVMAATLVQIKSRMLLPADETELDEEDGPDPREELVRRLLEYKQYKDAAGRLDDRERLWREVFYRDHAVPATILPPTETLIEDVTLFDLVDSLQAILARTPHPRLIEIAAEQVTVNDRMNRILDMLDGKESLTFVSLFENHGHRLLVIVTFLAVLELTRLKLVRVFQGAAFGPILLTRSFTPVAEQSLDAAGSEGGWEGT